MDAHTNAGEDAHAPLFEGARTHNAWLSRKVSADTLRDLYDRLRWAPTSANSNPGRFIFLRSPAAKLRLKVHLSPQNVDKTMSAPVCVIVAADAQFFDRMPLLSPQRDFKAIFEGAPDLAAETATRNAILQGAYLILAARSLGLDCGPMSGFDRKAVDAEFCLDGRWQSNFLVNLGYGDESKLWPRNPRLAFDDACQIL